jgi:hypothetical protein
MVTYLDARAFLPGACDFFTVNPLDRCQSLLVDHIKGGLARLLPRAIRPRTREWRVKENPPLPMRYLLFD